jgi:hypothetical protein
MTNDYQKRVRKMWQHKVRHLTAMLKLKDERILFLEQERIGLHQKCRQYAEINSTISEAWRSLRAALDVIRGLKRAARKGKKRSYVRPTGRRK